MKRLGAFAKHFKWVHCAFVSIVNNVEFLKTFYPIAWNEFQMTFPPFSFGGQWWCNITPLTLFLDACVNQDRLSNFHGIYKCSQVAKWITHVLLYVFQILLSQRLKRKKGCLLSWHGKKVKRLRQRTSKLSLKLLFPLGVCGGWHTGQIALGTKGSFKSKWLLSNFHKLLYNHQIILSIMLNFYLK